MAFEDEFFNLYSVHRLIEFIPHNFSIAHPIQALKLLSFIYNFRLEKSICVQRVQFNLIILIPNITGNILYSILFFFCMLNDFWYRKTRGINRILIQIYKYWACWHRSNHRIIQYSMFNELTQF